MDKCNYHDAVQSTVEAIERWRAVDNHRQETSEKKLDKICKSIEEIERRMSKLEGSLPAIYETRSDAEAAYKRLHERVDMLHGEMDKKIQTTVKNAITITGVAVGAISTAVTIIVNLLAG